MSTITTLVGSNGVTTADSMAKIKNTSKWVELRCNFCGTPYKVVPCRLHKSKFCSRTCQVKGQVWTQERKEKIGKATRKPRPSIAGAKNYNWKGGSWNFIKTLVRVRDNDICQCTGACNWHLGQKCGFKDSYIMHVDHIKPKTLYPELKFIESNLITVCPNCHQFKTNTERRNKIFKFNKK